MISHRKRGIEASILRLACCGLAMGLFILIPGCKPRAREAQHVEVSGKVLYKGQPLPGGTVSFVAVNGGFSDTNVIDENGNYKVNAPVGEVRIGVSNRMLLAGGGKQEGESKGEKSMREQKAAEQKKKGPLVKGRYVRLPFDFGDPTKSGLKYTVKPEPQTYDINIPDNPPGQ